MKTRQKTLRRKSPQTMVDWIIQQYQQDPSLEGRVRARLLTLESEPAPLRHAQLRRARERQAE